MRLLVPSARDCGGNEWGLLGALHVGAEFFGFAEVDMDDFALAFVGIEVHEDANAFGHAVGHGDF